ncbi:MAG: hypothetical protein KDB43_07695 [Nocardioidaceae bacterium]|nr:hypothetical protein [Nocardioidaceae bacterium]
MERLLRAQAGTVSRRQLTASGLRPHDIERLLRRRDLTRMLPGVFVDHTGRPTWLQQAWAGILYYEPATLAGRSALRAALGQRWTDAGHAAPIEVAVALTRRTADLPGYRVQRVARLAERVQPSAAPPRLRVEEAALDIAMREPSDLAAIGILADVCQSRRTTARRIRAALDARPRASRRSWFESVLEDIADGTCSTLEQAYLDRVERAHALPRAHRQRPGRARVGVPQRGVDYDPLPLIVELDSRLFHDNAEQRDVDLDRDLDAAVDGRVTIRIGWGQVFDRPCRTAGRVAALLVRAGWTGRARRCGPDCRL